MRQTASHFATNFVIDGRPTRRVAAKNPDATAEQEAGGHDCGDQALPAGRRGGGAPRGGAVEGRGAAACCSRSLHSSAMIAEAAGRSSPADRRGGVHPWVAAGAAGGAGGVAVAAGGAGAGLEFDVARRAAGAFAPNKPRRSSTVASEVDLRSRVPILVRPCFTPPPGKAPPSA
jgi:hypothetical protein